MGGGGARTVIDAPVGLEHVHRDALARQRERRDDAHRSASRDQYR